MNLVAISRAHIAGIASMLLGICLNVRARAEDWPMLGRDNTRNGVSTEINPPTFWRVVDTTDKERRLLPRNRMSGNMKWSVQLGSEMGGDPVVANGLVWIGTNNTPLNDLRLPDKALRQPDKAVLMCVREMDGEIVYNYESDRMPLRIYDPPYGPMASTPLIEGDLLWFMTNRYSIVCLDVGPLQRGEGNPNEIWKKDMIQEFDISPRASYMNFHQWSSVASYKEWIYAITGNGVGEDYETVLKPNAPSLVCLEKRTGNLIWQDSSPGKNILFGQWSSPLVVEVNGRAQVIAAQGDGWVRSFDALSGELIWQFDMNRKAWKWQRSGKANRSYFLATPVFHDNRVYVSVGQVWEDHFTKNGRLCCIDATKTGDISTELAVDKNNRPIPHRRVQAVDTAIGERAFSNENSGLIWEFAEGAKGEDTMSSSMSRVAIKNGLLITANMDGIVHCLDAKSGRKYWTHESLSTYFGSPIIVDERIYLANEERVDIFRLSEDPKLAMYAGRPFAANETGIMSFGSTSPVFANGVLYVANRSNLFAIESDQSITENGETRDPPQSVETKGRIADAPFVPTPEDVASKMLAFASVTREDVVYDLGSGDGRIVIAAAMKYGCRAVGYEIDPELVALSRENVRKAGVQNLVKIESEDIFTIDLSKATVITVFLYPRLLERLVPQLQKLQPGSRIVSHHFEIPEFRPEKEIQVFSEEDMDNHKLTLWTTPLKQ